MATLMATMYLGHAWDAGRFRHDLDINPLGKRGLCSYISDYHLPGDLELFITSAAAFMIGSVKWRRHGETAVALPDGVRAMGSSCLTTFVCLDWKCRWRPPGAPNDR